MKKVLRFSLMLALAFTFVTDVHADEAQERMDRLEVEVVRLQREVAANKAASQKALLDTTTALQADIKRASFFLVKKAPNDLTPCYIKCGKGGGSCITALGGAKVEGKFYHYQFACHDAPAGELACVCTNF